MNPIDYKRLFDNCTDIICILNLEGHIVQANQAFMRALGYSESEVSLQSLSAYLHPSDLDSASAQFKQLRQNQVTDKFTIRVRHKHGHYLWLSWSAHLDAGSATVFASARDLTDTHNRNTVAEQIKDAMTSGAILAQTDPNGLIIDVNDNFCRVSGYSRQELIGQTHRVVNSGTHTKEFFTNLWGTIAGKNTWKGLIKNRTKKGEIYYVQTVITPILNDDDEIVSYFAIRHDTTQSILRQRELNSTLQILNQTSAIAKIGGWELNIASGDLTWSNETFRMLDVTKSADQKPKLAEGVELFIPQHRPIINKAVNRAIEFGEPYELVLQAQTQKGDVFWVLTSGQANYEKGKITTLSGTIQDIDIRKKAELKYNTEKLKSIQNAKLASLGELSASMAHEINNPLGIISGYAELMQASKNRTESDERKLDIIIKSSERIAHIVRNLRRFSHPDETTSHSPLKLSTVIRDAISLANPRLKRQLVELDFAISTDTVIDGHAIELEQVFLNLINNAIDAVDDQKDKWIRISLEETPLWLEVRVIDSGAGIPDAIKNEIFSAFFTSKEQGKGTGLGLSIVSDILSAHSASIELDDNAPNTCFKLAFPIVKKVKRT